MYNYGPTLRLSISDIRVMGVLQRIALCYLFVSLMALYTKPKSQAVAVAGILVFYWAVMRLVPVPGYGAGIWTEQGNLARYIDDLLLPGSLFHGTWDPEGLLSTLPAFATCLLGALAGYWLKVTKWRDRVLSNNDRALYLFLGGMVLAILGILADPFFPINKNLWTSSYVLLTGGLSAILLAAFYWVVDLKGYRAAAFLALSQKSFHTHLKCYFNRQPDWV